MQIKGCVDKRVWWIIEWAHNLIKFGRQYMTILGAQSSKFSIWGDSCTSSSLLRLTNKPGRLWSSSCRRRVRRSSRGSTTGGWSTLLYFQSPGLPKSLCLLLPANIFLQKYHSSEFVVVLSFVVTLLTYPTPRITLFVRPSGTKFAVSYLHASYLHACIRIRDQDHRCTVRASYICT